MDTPSNFRDFYLGLNERQRDRFARLADSTDGYIRAHLIAPPARRKVPRKPLFDKLVQACRELGAPFSRTQLLEYFYEQQQEKGRSSA